MRENVAAQAYSPSSATAKAAPRVQWRRASNSAVSANGMPMTKAASSAAPPTCISQNGPVAR